MPFKLKDSCYITYLFSCKPPKLLKDVLQVPHFIALLSTIAILYRKVYE